MSSYQNFRNDYYSRARRKNPAIRPKSMVSVEQISKEKKEQYKKWITFYRRNMHRFVEHYLEIKLHPYQVLWIYMMNLKDSFIAVASRAAAKSWLIGVFATARAILYPDSLIIIVASTKEQAGVIVEEKIKQLQESYPNVNREISKLTTNQNIYTVEFRNGSKIRVVPSRDSARGKHKKYFLHY